MSRLSEYAAIAVLLGPETFPVVDNPGVAGGTKKITAADLAASAVFTSRYVPGTVAAQNSAASFNTVATHTNYQDTGLTLTFTPLAGRRYRFTLMVNPYAPGGAQDVEYQLLAGAGVLRAWFVGQRSTGFPYAVTLQHTYLPGAIGSTVFKIQFRAVNNNTQVSDYADATTPKQFYIEDIGSI